MQAVQFAPSFTPSAIPRNPVSSQPKICRFSSTRANALSVNYNSTLSVFPAEACETVGGDACLVDMYPEMKLKSEAKSNKLNIASEPDRDYLDYSDLRTVLLGDACDVLGGEFCEGAYQMGIC